jgi:hypothetical protein
MARLPGVSSEHVLCVIVEPLESKERQKQSYQGISGGSTFIGVILWEGGRNPVRPGGHVG